MAKLPPIDNLLLRLIDESEEIALFWQLGVLAVCALVAWYAVRRAKPYLVKTDDEWEAGRGALRRVGLPLALLLCVLAGRALADIWLTSTHLLNLAVPLLIALVLVRGIVFGLRYAFRADESTRLLERATAWLIWGAFALHITGVAPRIQAALQALSFTSGKHTFSLWLLAQAVVVIVVAVVAALALSRFVENRLMGVTQMNLSLRMALSKAARTVLLILAVLVTLPAVGIDITVLSVFGGALGVGLGFGLQKVASNYISGFIILLDRSIRIGDLVTVDNQYGEVSQINTRYTLLRALDGTETIVPNENFITQTVVNHSLSEPTVRVAVSVGVSYNTDLDHARELMLAAADEHARVVHDDPEAPPRVFLKEFADSSIVLELAVWIRDPSEGQANLKSDLNWSIWRAFKAAGVEIPFPQRVIHMPPAQP